MKNCGVEIIKNWWGNGNILIFWPKLGRKHYLFRGWKNSRESEKNSCKSEKFSHVNKNSCEYEKILSSLNKNFHESEKNSLQSEKNSCKSEKILACLKKNLE